MEAAAAAAPTPTTSASPLVNRERNYTLSCVQCHAVESLPEKKVLQCGRCKFVRYCGAGASCQKLHFASHKRDCKIIQQIREIHMHPENLLWLASRQFQMARKCSDTIEQGKYMYEQALDSYVGLYEAYRSQENFSVHDIVPLRSRIPFLLAALGHDTLAMQETELCMMRWSRGGRSNDLSVFSDLIKKGFGNTPRLIFTSWPKCFLLPVLLVKLRVVAELRRQEKMLSEFKMTDFGQKLEDAEDVVTVVRDFFMHSLPAQTDQMLFLMRITDKNHGGHASFLDFSDPDSGDGEGTGVFADVHEDDDLRECEYLFVRDALRENPHVRAIVDAEKGPVSETKQSKEGHYFQSLFKEEEAPQR
jgi:hypothetical protein